jgi:hypothetical protein
MTDKRPYWQSVRGLCILAVVLIHVLGNHIEGFETEFIIVRQIANFTVATFIFMAGYFVDTNRLVHDRNECKKWIVSRGGACSSHTCCGLCSTAELVCSMTYAAVIR